MEAVYPRYIYAQKRRTIMENSISVSKMRCLLSCSLKYYFKYVAKLPSPMCGALLLGKSVHAAAESSMRFKMEKESDMPLDTILDVFSQSFEGFQQNEPVDLEGEDKGKLKDSGYALTRLFATEVLPSKNPVLIEHEFNIPFDNTNYVYRGFIDEISADGVVSDLKTAAKSWPEDSLTNGGDLQMIGYAFAYRQLFGQPEKGLRLEILVKNKTPKLQILTAEPRTDKEIDRFLKIMGSCVALIEQKIFVPASSRFNCATCSFSEECKKW